jgi:hypothetical protein
LQGSLVGDDWVVKPEEPIDFTLLALDHTTNVMELALSGDLRESPSKQMITDAAMIQQLERIANAIENIEDVLVGITRGERGIDITCKRSGA